MRGRSVVIIDVLRASTTIITALAEGVPAIAPVADPDEARRRAPDFGPGTLLAGERGGERIAGFDLGNSPVAFQGRRWAGRPVVFTTSNGTRALLAAREAAAVAIAALINVSAAAKWAAGRSGAVTVVCAGERGRPSLEDTVCAGLLADRAGLRTTPSADEAIAVARRYADDLRRLAADAPWARHLVAAGHGGDVDACLALDVTDLVPVYRADVDKVVPGPQ